MHHKTARGFGVLFESQSKRLESQFAYSFALEKQSEFGAFLRQLIYNIRTHIYQQISMQCSFHHFPHTVVYQRRTTVRKIGYVSTGSQQPTLAR